MVQSVPSIVCLAARPWRDKTSSPCMLLLPTSRRRNDTALRELRGFDLNGACAGVAHHDDWEDEVTAEVTGQRLVEARGHCTLQT